MNLAFNAVMWALFTRALTLASSTVRVSVINTSANFMLTAVLGVLVFSEQLPGKSSTSQKEAIPDRNAGLWWLGAAMLVAGSVIIGRREEGKEVGTAGTAGTAGNEPAVGAQQGFRDEGGAPLAGAGGMSSDSEVGGGDSIELRRKAKGRAS